MPAETAVQGTRAAAAGGRRLLQHGLFEGSPKGLSSMAKAAVLPFCESCSCRAVGGTALPVALQLQQQHLSLEMYDLIMNLSLDHDLVNVMLMDVVVIQLNVQNYLMVK